MTAPWEQRQFRELVRFSLPMGLALGSYTLTSLVDTWLVSGLGKVPLAGLGLGVLASSMILTFWFGLLRGTKVMVAIAVGARQPGEVQGAVGAAVLLALAAGFLDMGLARLAVHAVQALAPSAASGEAGGVYLRIVSLGWPLLLLALALEEALIGQGLPRMALLAALLANGCNMVVAYYLIRYRGAGLAGAAWGSVAAYALEAAFVLGAQGLRGLGLRAVRLRHLRKLISLGVPIGCKNLLVNGAYGTTTAILAPLGEVVIAAHQVMSQLQAFALLPLQAIGEAGAVLVGYALGARRDFLIRKVARRALVLAAGVALSISAAMLLFRQPLIRVFASDAALADALLPLLVVVAAGSLFNAAESVGASVMRGVGDVRYASVVSIAAAWLCAPPLAWWGGYRLGGGAMGAWIGVVLSLGLSSVLLWWRLEGGRWAQAAERARATRASRP